jgi:alkylation response protein AidB-like acyl-CoA dehydrogenase
VHEEMRMFVEYTEKQLKFRDMIAAFVNSEIRPLNDTYDLNAPFTAADIRKIWQKMIPVFLNPKDGEAIIDMKGIQNVTHSGEGLLGGLPIDTILLGIAIEEIAKVNPSLMCSIMISLAPAGIIMVSRNEEMKKKYILPVLTGQKIGCAAITEPGFGSHSAGFQTTAVLRGDHWLVNGTKTWISNGDISDICVLLCSCDDGNGEPHTAQLVVDREISPYRSRSLVHMGLKQFPAGEIVFDQVRVPASYRISGSKEKKGDGLKKTLQAFEISRCCMALCSVGIAQAAIDASVAHVKERRQFGKLLGEFQMIQEMISDMATETEAARLLAYRALSLIQAGKRAEAAAAMAKQYATEMAIRVTSKAVQIHGKDGLSEDFPIERMFRDARMLTIPDGTTQIQKLILGRALTGLSAFS